MRFDGRDVTGWRPYQMARTDLAAGLEIERCFVHNYATAEPDASEGLLAFKQKRKPRFGA